MKLEIYRFLRFLTSSSSWGRGNFILLFSKIYKYSSKRRPRNVNKTKDRVSTDDRLAITLSVRSTFHFDSAQHLGRSPSIGQSKMCGNENGRCDAFHSNDIDRDLENSRTKKGKNSRREKFKREESRRKKIRRNFRIRNEKNRERKNKKKREKFEKGFKECEKRKKIR